MILWPGFMAKLRKLLRRGDGWTDIESISHDMHDTKKVICFQTRSKKRYFRTITKIDSVQGTVTFTLQGRDTPP